MKKLLALLLALMLALSLVACEEKDDDRKRSRHSTRSSAQKEEDKTQEEEEIEEEFEAEATKKFGKLKSSKFEGAEAEAEDQFKFEITDIQEVEYSSDYFVLKTKMENLSEDTSYRCTIDAAAIDGTMVEASLFAEVGAGKKANEEITVYITNLEGSGLNKYTDIYLRVNVSDAEDYSADPIIEEDLHVYPYGEDKATEYKRKEKKSDEVLVDNDSVKITLVDTGSDDYYAHMLKVYVENKTDEFIRVSTDDASVNGYMMDASFYLTVAPGLTAYDYITWSKDSFKENDIDDVEEIELTLEAINSGYSTIFEETVTITSGK